ncbi:unnamed protein product [Cercopithifilaria johnstoni]|uniref:Uncharacterized protein n=1 Tax=Cercopithifilaria johnstoni TaxID=2874296 RepID=A0A8J2Q9E9_9BILA|nr:unnamed protein product [Cercopithifilaria johnstoni]
MPSRLGSRPGCTVVQQMPRQVKKVSVPKVPDINAQKYGTCQTNVIEAAATRDLYELEGSVILQRKNGLLENGRSDKSTKSPLNVIHIPSTSMTALMVPSSLCVSDDSYSAHMLFSRRKALMLTRMTADIFFTLIRCHSSKILSRIACPLK